MRQRLSGEGDQVFKNGWVFREKLRERGYFLVFICSNRCIYGPARLMTATIK